ncbi:hypothetical protein [Lewinella sp. JB7]|uniref:hypothetical protein n=1 Tax=Lewinella sp. JB7 TaxID=2962887 RepID=UPI0020C9D8E3|nr:hypothetical protein [Lewinella sp. JB7]
MNYEATADEYAPYRLAKAEIKTVVFKTLDRTKFCAQMCYYQSGNLPLSPQILPTKVDLSTEPFVFHKIPHAPAQDSVDLPKRTINKGPQTKTVQVQIPIADLTIKDGGVKGSFEEYGVGHPLSFTIVNQHLLKEFHPIRDFFARRLRRKTVEVTALLKFRADGDPELCDVQSPQIDKIDEGMIQVLRTNLVHGFIRADKTDKRLFTPEDLMANYAEDAPERTLLPPPGIDLLREILDKKAVRNAAHLTHLSNVHERGQKLQFVVCPCFGFLFFIRGEFMHHFVLELLNSHATYIWSMPKESGTLAEHLNYLTTEIEHLNSLGRSNYRRMNTFEYCFRVINHDSVSSEFVDGFPRWKARLEEGLV